MGISRLHNQWMYLMVGKVLAQKKAKKEAVRQRKEMAKKKAKKEAARQVPKVQEQKELFRKKKVKKEKVMVTHDERMQARAIQQMVRMGRAVPGPLHLMVVVAQMMSWEERLPVKVNLAQKRKIM